MTCTGSDRKLRRQNSNKSQKDKDLLVKLAGNSLGQVKSKFQSQENASRKKKF
jgi:hypothetical protein